MIERNASEHLPKTSELFDLADMAGGLAAFISNRTTRFESDRGVATLLLLCLNWCPVTIYLHAVAIRGWIRPAIFAAGCTYVRCQAAVAIRGWIRPAISAAGCGYLQLNIHLA